MWLARAWYESPAYQQILRLRTDHVEGDVLLIEGVGPEYDPRERSQKLQAEAKPEPEPEPESETGAAGRRP
ncbi:DUF1330 domain-containing protein [Streptomyces sp. RGM 3693]|uniref:DUF1330 domain-containing protein n=1 Tax=Streptomyces sp. RGM 3693 TaxID=3413284 RepID=UPI003D2D95D2